jgi:hypothetical protein
VAKFTNFPFVMLQHAPNMLLSPTGQAEQNPDESKVEQLETSLALQDPPPVTEK